MIVTETMYVQLMLHRVLLHQDQRRTIFRDFVYLKVSLIIKIDFILGHQSTL